jgi:hypothetical protein
MARCTATAASGEPCKATAQPGRDVCKWHDETPEGRARRKAESRRGGLAKAYGSLPTGAPLADDPKVATLDLGTPDGLRGFLSASLHALARLPFDARTANAIGQLATAQRSLIETSDFEKRLAVLEAAANRPNLRAG